jgi:mRNA interferase MazF
VVSRGEIGWLDFGQPLGHMPAKRRPVVVVQTDGYNRSGLGTVVVVSLTSNLGAADKPGNVFLSMAATGLPKDSVANITQISTVNRYDLEATGVIVPVLQQRRIDDGLRMLLGL